jgi:hypothetical protein
MKLCVRSCVAKSLAAGANAFALLMSVGCNDQGQGQGYEDRHYYGAKLEPVTRVLHGAGAVVWEDVAAYRDEMKLPLYLHGTTEANFRHALSP